MKKILGIVGLLVFVCVVTALATDRFLTPGNIENLIRRSALFGILSIGAGFVIVTGGIDLAIGSVVGLTGVLLPWMLAAYGCSVPVALAIALGSAAAIGLVQGLLITRLALQPFVVTLCGLLLFRGLARGLTDDQTVGFGVGHAGLRSLAGRIELTENFGLPVPMLFLIVVVIAAGLFFNRTVWGRWLKALGRNEEATRLSGIHTKRLIVAAYVICAVLSGLGGVLFVIDVNSAQPSDFGNFYELYAIAGAVLGGCALSGGEISIIGVVVGAAVMQVLRNSIRLIDAIPTQIEFAVIGAVILGGVIADEVVKRMAARRR